MNKIGRRDFLLSTAAGLTLAGIGGPRRAEAASEIVWGTNEAYSRPHLLAPFVEDTGIAVRTELFSDPAEVVTKLAVGGAGVHVLLDGSYHVAISHAEGVIKPLNAANVPNLEHALPEIKAADGLIFGGQRYGIPIVWGTDSIIYRNDIVGEEINDIGALFDDRFAGRIAMPDGLFESLIVGALYLGIKNPFAMNREELDEVAALLIKQKPLLRTYWRDIGDLKHLVATGEVVIGWGWQPVMELRRDGIDVQWAHPKQGELAWYDACYLTTEADGEAQEGSEHLLNFLLGDFYGRALGEEAGYRTASTLAIDAMSDELRTELDLDQASTFLKNASWWVSPTDPQAYQDAWDRVIAA